MTEIIKDVVIIGSGPAGASCAYTVGEGGLDALLIEKDGKLGGAAGGGMGIFAAGTDEIKAMNYTMTVEQAYKGILETSHYMANARVVRELVVRSNEILQWLKSCGVKFEKIPSAYFQGANYTWHKTVQDMNPDDMFGTAPPTEGLPGTAPAAGMPAGGPPAGMPAGGPPAGMPAGEPPAEMSSGGFNMPMLLDDVYATIAKRFPNVQIRKNTRALHLVKEEGRVVGVICQDENGQELMLRCKAVFMATGGFAANSEMVKENTKYTIGDTVFNFGSKAATGDGLRMAREVGADGDNILIETIACMEPPCNGPGGVPFSGGILRQPTMLMVNQDGERFVNEETFYHFGYMGNAVYRQKNHTAYVIFDDATNKYYEDNILDYQLTGETRRSDNFPAYMRETAASGYKHFFEADSVEELAKQMGIDEAALAETVNKYNDDCARGVDSLLFKQAKYLRPVKTGKLYAARFGIGTYGSMGGVRINHKGEVLDKSGNAIAGLYAGGFDANSIFGDTFPFEFAGIGSTFSYVFGRVSGENILGKC